MYAEVEWEMCVNGKGFNSGVDNVESSEAVNKCIKELWKFGSQGSGRKFH